MTPFHDKAKILPDGHLPLPESFHGQAGDEVDVTVLSTGKENGAAEATERADDLIRTWAGVGRGSGRGVAESHDEHLYEP